MAQAVHAAVAFALKWPERAASTPNVVVLAVRDEDELVRIAEVDGLAPDYGMLFHEPDLDDEATAYANVCEPGRFSSLPLAGRVIAMA